MQKTRKPLWKKPNPRKKSGRKAIKLTPAQKEAARERARRAGRRYPNLVDNMWASQRGEVSRKERHT